MRTWMVLWKPDEWDWPEGKPELVRRGGEFIESWKFAFRNDAPMKGDRIFVKRTRGNDGGPDWPNGIVAAGHIAEDGFHDEQDVKGAVSSYVKIAFDWILEDLTDPLRTADLKAAFPAFVNWEPHNSGTLINVDCSALEEKWAEKIGFEHDIMNVLKVSAEIDPYKHDPSYELIQAAVDAYKGSDFDKLTFKDLDFVYATVHILKNPTKRKKIENSTLPEQKKKEMLGLFDRCLEKWKRSEYNNNNPENNPGLFKPGFQTFDRKGRDDDLPSKLMRLLVDVRTAITREEAYKAIEDSSIAEWMGIAPASLSEMLHCLRPKDFPIMNSNEGLNDIYTLLIPSMQRTGTTPNYMEWTRALSSMKDDCFPFSNFRVIDLAQRHLGQKEQHGIPCYAVFQNNTFDHESNEGYIQSPIAGKGGKVPWHWKTMGDVRVGDLIFHLVNQTVKAISVATRPLYNDGTSQMVGCNYHVLTNPVDLRPLRQTIIDLQKNSRNAPFTKKGEGNQIYLAHLLPSLARVFAEKAKETNSDMDLSFLDPLFNGESFDEGKKDSAEEKNMSKQARKTSLNTILYGPPGTGKTYNAIFYAVAVCDGKPLEEVIAGGFKVAKERFDKLIGDGRIVFTTFHQSYGYEDFIEGIKPKTVKNGGKEEVVYETLPGVFKRFCENARPGEGAKKEPYVFVIDEINRGNISKIFGELITLIEESKREGADEAMSAKLPYSGEVFAVPDNVYILGTMNTADRSIALMDTALRRRFHFEERMPDPTVLEGVAVTEKGKTFDVKEALEVMNRRIEILYDREHTLGHALFIGLKKEPTLAKLASIFRDSIVPLLQEYFYEDYEKIQLVLGDNAKAENQKFVRDIEEKTDVVFRGNPSRDPETRYEIQEEAFYDIDSYIGIVKEA